MNTRQAVVLIISGGLLFQLGCGESGKRVRNAPDAAVIETNVTEQEATAPSGNEAIPADGQEGTPASPQETNARIAVENPVYDFGAVGPNKKVKCEFKFKNVGTDELVIERVLSTCQCTVAELKKKNYAPGESGVVEATYLSASYAGPVEKHLTILSNDTSNPRCELTIKGRIELQVVTEPADRLELFLSQPNAGAKSITIKSKDGKAFAVRSFSSSHNTISATFDPQVEKTEHVITPTVDVQKLKANLTGSIQIGLSHPETNSVSLTYMALPMYTLSPPRLIVQEAEPGKSIDREILVVSNYDEKVDVDSITSLNGYMEVTAKEDRGNSVRLMIRITPPPQEGNNRRWMSDRLTVRMKNGDEVSATCSGWYKLNTLK